MPSRKDIFVNGNYYHVFNKTIDHKLVFDKTISTLFLQLIRYYRSQKADIRYSYFLKLDPSIKLTKEKKLANSNFFKVDILCYCLMPNHFHLLVKQVNDKGIIRFMADIINSLTRSYNLFHERKGPLFLPQFRSRRITTREQLIHVSRYIHLNPYSSGIVHTYHELSKSNKTSLHEYVSKEKFGLCNTDIILGEFKQSKTYYTFISNNMDYQQKLEEIKYVEKWI